MKFDPMLTALCIGVVIIALSFWRAQKRADFDVFDLVMEGGKVSKTAVAFMLVLVVSTWVIVYLMVKDKLTEGYFTIYTGAWIIPLVARVVFNKTEAPGTTTISSTTTVTKEPLQ